MCGICGIISQDKLNRVNLLSMNKMISHRGPDDEGYFLDNNIGLAMRRLSIIDLHSGNQPMVSEDKRYVIVFNGEIYNYKELKSTYLRNYNFITLSDTEVVLCLYAKLGIKALNYLNGMYAFCIYDQLEKKIVIVRDKIGIKPLYYYKNGSDFLFSSEIKSFWGIKGIDLSLNLNYLNDFISFGFIPSPKTIYKYIFSLDPGYYINILNNESSLNKYWEYNINISNEKLISYDDTKSALKELLENTVKMEMVSDVPIGCFLSGGLDSSIIAYEMNKVSDKRINTFTITFSESRNNKDKIFSRSISNKLLTRHNERELNIDNANIGGIIEKLDEPFAISSLIPYYLNSMAASKNLKVVLSGDGADEIFGGYSRYSVIKYLLYLKSIKYLEKNKIDIIRNNISKLLRKRKLVKGFDKFLISNLTLISNDDIATKYLNYLLNTNEETKKYIFNKELYNEFDDLTYVSNLRSKLDNHSNIDGNDFLLFDVQTSLKDEMLRKVDIASMLNGLEVRVPFLNDNITNFAFSLPFEYKFSGYGKKILKDIYKDYLGNELVFSKKRGFNMPMEYWLKNNLAEDFFDLLNSELPDKLMLDSHFLLKEFSNYVKGKSFISENTFYYLYNILCWYRKYSMMIYA